MVVEDAAEEAAEEEAEDEDKTKTAKAEGEAVEVEEAVAEEEVAEAEVEEEDPQDHSRGLSQTDTTLLRSMDLSRLKICNSYLKFELLGTPPET
jgi:hypothetical protein